MWRAFNSEENIEMSFAASAVRALRQAPKVAQRGFQTSKTTASVCFGACVSSLQIFRPLSLWHCRGNPSVA